MPELYAQAFGTVRNACADLDMKARRQEEKLVQTDNESKRLQGGYCFNRDVDKVTHKQFFTFSYLLATF